VKKLIWSLAISTALVLATVAQALAEMPKRY
jgi:hypothetical protein